MIIETTLSLFAIEKIGKKLTETKLADSELENLAQEKNISAKGWKYLGKKLKKQGFLTNFDIRDLLEVEIEEKKNNQEKKNKERNLANKGTKMLLDRIKKETSSF